MKIRGKWHFRRAVCLHNTEHVRSDSKVVAGGNAENAQHAQNAPHAVQRQSQRQRAAHVAESSVCVFFWGGVEPQFSYHTAIFSRGGGEGFQPRFPGHRAIGNRCGIFFCGTPPVRLCWAQTGHYMSDRHNTPLLYSQETGISTTYCDLTSLAPVEKKSLSALKLPNQSGLRTVTPPGFVGVRPLAFRSGFPKRGEETL